MVNPACEQTNCVCANLPGWPKVLGSGVIVHLHAETPVLKEQK